MYNILTLNKISETGMVCLKPDKYKISMEENEPDGIILRSFDMHKYEMPKTLKAISRAGAGVNNIPIDKCSEKGIVVFNTPGANANAVKELVITSLFLSSRKISQGINWTQTLKGKEDVAKLVEKGKGDFVGPEIFGKKLGVIGLGAIGVLVANACYDLGMNVFGYDPYLSVDAAWNFNRGVTRCPNLETIFEECDYITLHLPLLKDTTHIINSDTIAQMKDGVRILNFARGELVCTDSIKKAVSSEKVSSYITDFPTEDILGVDGIIPIPHLGASTPESEENCAVMASLEMKNYLQYGNIENSVNFPNCSLPYTGKTRICIIHENRPHSVSSITSAIGNMGLNIENMISQVKGNNEYTIIDVDKDEYNKDDHKLEDEIMKIEDVIRIRIL